MRNLQTLEEYRRRDLENKAGRQRDNAEPTASVRLFWGIFEFKSKIDAATLRVVLSAGYGGWDHVSVSRKNRMPNWIEMEQVRRLCFEDDEAVMQYHPPLAEYVDGTTLGCVNCLHLWRPINEKIPTPPKWMVGGMTVNEADEMAQKDGA